MPKRGSEFDIIWKGLGGGIAFAWLMGFAVGYRDSITPWVLLISAITCFVISKRV
jgi:hypothetical protein